MDCEGSQIVNPLALQRGLTEKYHNRSLATVNDHEIRMSVMTGTFGWHRHPASDETFLVIEGALAIDLEDREIVLGPGDMFTVQKDVLHRTRAVTARSVNLTFERISAQTLFVAD